MLKIRLRFYVQYTGSSIALYPISDHCSSSWLCCYLFSDIDVTIKAENFSDWEVDINQGSSFYNQYYCKQWQCFKILKLSMKLQQLELEEVFLSVRYFNLNFITMVALFIPPVGLMLEVCRCVLGKDTTPVFLTVSFQQTWDWGVFCVPCRVPGIDGKKSPTLVVLVNSNSSKIDLVWC